MWIRTKEEKILKSDIYALSKAKKYGKRIEDLCDEILIYNLKDDTLIVSDTCDYEKYLEIAKGEHDKIDIMGCIRCYDCGNDKDFWRSQLCTYLFKYNRFVPALDFAFDSNYEGDEDVEKWLKENE